ncbi:hypothetical protein BK699_22280 [Bacillus thuringiensis serovar mexicanensis]|uniref:Uncharacterized protein n=1 Tax=Bacillus thuringiensis serovar mexicanensis TaxID=180868 RepID=A0A242W3A3_BACTU|nr:hypothetical protein BK699_22280 [Bacillus thuringiensis serovar mexicanensis]OTX10432.1 hypothetical protein BK705_02855 [Bacillus thuringiensis serovar monterrey]
MNFLQDQTAEEYTLLGKRQYIGKIHVKSMQDFIQVFG